MAAVASTAVTFNKTWVEKHPGGVEIRVRKVTVVLSSQGSDANYISASILDLNTILESSPGIASDDGNAYLLVPNVAGTKLLVVTSTSDAPADVTKTLTFVVRGY